MGEEGQALNLEDLSGVQDAADVGGEEESGNEEGLEAGAQGGGEGDEEGGDDSDTRNLAAEKRIQGLIAENAKNKAALDRERKKSAGLETRQADMEARIVAIEGGGNEIPEPDDEAPADEWREYNRKVSLKQQQEFDQKLIKERMDTRQAIAEARYDGRDGGPTFGDMLEKWSDTIFANEGFKTRMGGVSNGHLEYMKIALELEDQEAKELGLNDDGGGGDQPGDDDMTDQGDKDKPAKQAGRLSPASRGTAPVRSQSDKTLKERYRAYVQKTGMDPYGSFKAFKLYTENGNKIRAKRAAGGVE